MLECADLIVGSKGECMGEKRMRMKERLGGRLRGFKYSKDGHMQLCFDRITDLPRM